MSSSPHTKITMTRSDIDRFRQSLEEIEAAFLDWAELKGIKDRYDYEFESISDEGITFSYIEWGYEPRYDGWNHHEAVLPLEFLIDRDLVAAEIMREREEKERERAAAEAAAALKRRRDTEAKERATLAQLQAKYGETS